MTDRHLGAMARKSRIAASRKWFVEPSPKPFASLTPRGFTHSRTKGIDSLAHV